VSALPTLTCVLLLHVIGLSLVATINIGGLYRLEVLCEDLEQKAREYRIYDMNSFYQSETFKRNGMQLDPTGRIIIKTFE